MKKQVLLLAVLFTGLTLFSETLTVPPADPVIHYAGRFSDDFRFGWTGCMIETDFSGSRISATMDLVRGKEAAVTALVDGKETVILVTPGKQSYLIADGLASGIKHRIVLFKRSEASFGTVRFGGFEISADGKLSAPAARIRKMLVIGDSITCGYGNEAAAPEEGNSVRNENGYMSYAAIAARTLDADLMMVCWSGRGLYRNLSPVNDKVDTVPQLFEQTLPQDKTPLWDMSKFVPDVIAINLGTNDTGEQGGKGSLQKADYVNAYVNFIKRLRTFAPESKIIISMGPMAADHPVKTWLPDVASQFDNVSVLIYPKFSGREEVGGNGHPNVKKDQMMAEQLESQIREMTGWK